MKLIEKTLFYFTFLTAVAWASVAGAAESPAEKAMLEVLSKKYSNARIELFHSDQKILESLKNADELVLLSDSGNGVAFFRVKNPQTHLFEQVKVSFSAWIEAPAAKRRIRPSEKLSADLFSIQKLDLARGVARQYRGLILPANTDFSKLESRQTILAGQFPTLTGVQRVPDVRRGDQIRLKLKTGSLSVSTLGIAQEAARVGEAVRVISLSTKRELTGKVLNSSQVEVQL